METTEQKVQPQRWKNWWRKLFAVQVLSVLNFSFFSNLHPVNKQCRRKYWILKEKKLSATSCSQVAQTAKNWDGTYDKWVHEKSRPIDTRFTFGKATNPGWSSRRTRSRGSSHKPLISTCRTDFHKLRACSEISTPYSVVHIKM